MNKNTMAKRHLSAQGVSLVALLVIIVFAVIVYIINIGITLAWFANNEVVKANGLQITSDYEDIVFTDEITVTRTFEETARIYRYKRDTDNVYYRINDDESWYLHSVIDENSNIIDGVREEFGFSGLVPNETLDVTVSFTNTGHREHTYTLDMKDITGDMFLLFGETYTVLGVYKVENNFVQPIDGLESVELLNIETGTIASGETASVTFRITFSLEQYSVVSNQTNSVLSEKSMTVGSINIGFND